MLNSYASNEDYILIDLSYIEDIDLSGAVRNIAIRQIASKVLSLIKSNNIEGLKRIALSFTERNKDSIQKIVNNVESNIDDFDRKVESALSIAKKYFPNFSVNENKLFAKAAVAYSAMTNKPATNLFSLLKKTTAIEDNQHFGHAIMALLGVAAFVISYHSAGRLSGAGAYILLTTLTYLAKFIKESKERAKQR